MAIEYKNLRAVMLDYLKKHSDGDFTLPNEDISQFFDNQGFQLEKSDWMNLQQVIHELYHDRIIFLGQRTGGDNQAWSFPWYRLTEYGKQVVNNPEYQPHDPTGYLSRIQADVPTIDPAIIRYLEEGINCYRNNLLLASAVMIGCSAEKAMLLLIDAFGNAIADAEKKAKYGKEVKARMISRKYEALWKRLGPLAQQLPDGLGDDMHVILDRVFDLIRTTRNDAGHPTGKKIERETVHANLLLFPSYCKRVYGLIHHFSHNKVS